MQNWQSIMLRGERVVWSGAPAQGLLLVGSDAFMIPFGVFFLSFALFWISMAMQAPGSFWAFGLIFVVVGLFITVGRFFVDAYLRSHTQYAVTDQRALIWRDGIGAKLTALDLRTLPPLTLQPRADGRGTIRFGDVPVWSRRNAGGMIPSLDPTPQFIVVDQANVVFDLIQRQQQKLRE